ncbi:hypothetical protein [Legionella tucsonensis]|uniref:Endonuclease/Exonuclease/phosphatase family protein n=1 Tax=Legionella tucsonensis TaxID=40335 RepID=A0A0W0ZX30_9GAMM|nr:hypothetical protein [Legionella tucsonensis]KTD73646.1 hypothetical protein Ltuc_1493 [Legionella tucsonensis]
MAKKLKTIVKTGTKTTTQEQNLHSDHHPQLFGKTLIWNIDKVNLNDDLEMKAFTIAQKINSGEVTSGMLQEIPHDSQDELIANIEKYLDPMQKLSMRYNQNGTHPFGNLTFSCNPVTPSPNQALEKDVKKLQQKYEDSGATKGQVLITLVEDENGKKRLLVNVHAESPPKPGAPYPPKIPRVDLNQVMKDVEQFRKHHSDIDVVVGGDMNNGPKSFPQEMHNFLPNPNFRYQHSEANTAFKRDGTSIAVDAVFSTEKGIDLKTQRNMNTCDENFLTAFKKSKDEKKQLAQQEKMKPVVDLQKNLKSSPAFTTATVHTGHYPQKIKQDTQQDFPIELVFKDARQARQFTNHVSLRDKKNLFQNDNKVYLTQGAVAKILTLDINLPKLAFTHVMQGHQDDKPSEQRTKELQQKCVEQIQVVKKVQISAAPTVKYENTKIRQDTRGEIDYSIQLTFASKEEARAFSDAMGYKNKTLLFQDNTNVYIAKDAEADFLKKMCKPENSASFKTHLAKLKSSSPLTEKDVTMSAPPSAKGSLS